MKYILVHGTGDADTDLDDDKRWWQSGSEFYKGLEARIDPADEIGQFTWTGENCVSARLEASDDLAKILTELRNQKINIIAHSHGGNVALMARNKAKSWSNHKIIGVGVPLIIHIGNFNIPYVLWFFRYFLCIFIAVTIIFKHYINTCAVNLTECAREIGKGDNTSFFAFLALLLAMPIIIYAIKDFVNLFRRQNAIYKDWTKTNYFYNYFNYSHEGDEVINSFNYIKQNDYYKPTVKQTRRLIEYVVLFTPYLFMAPMFLLFALFIAESLVYISFFLIDSNTEALIPESANLNNLITIRAMQIYIIDIFPYLVFAFVPLIILAAFSMLFAGHVARAAASVISGFGMNRITGNKDGATITFKPEYDPLPEEISDNLLRYANRNFANYISNHTSTLRAKFITDPVNLLSIDSAQFWDGIIHTCYFREPSCRKFLVDRLSE